MSDEADRRRTRRRGVIVSSRSSASPSARARCRRPKRPAERRVVALLTAPGRRLPTKNPETAGSSRPTVEPDRDRAADRRADEQPERERDQRGHGDHDRRRRCRKRRTPSQELAGASPSGAQPTRPRPPARLAHLASASAASSRAGSGRRQCGRGRTARMRRLVDVADALGWKRGQRGWKRHARRRVDRARHVALEHDPLALRGRGPGSGSGTAESSAPVYGCFGSVVELVAVGELDDLAEVHHHARGRRCAGRR